MSLPSLNTQVIASQDTTNRSDPVDGYKIPAATDTPERIAAVGTYVGSVTIFSGRNTQGTANTSSCYIDRQGAADGAGRIEIPVGGFITIVAPLGKFFDLGDWYLDVVTQGDGVFYRGDR